MLRKRSSSRMNRSMSMSFIHQPASVSAPATCTDFYRKKDEDLYISRSSSGPPLAHFLDACFICNKRLGHGHDIYMYRGDTAFCSEECRQQQIAYDKSVENVAVKASNCHGNATKAKYPTEPGMVLGEVK